MLSPFSSPLQNRLFSHKGMLNNFIRTCCAVCRPQISGFWFWEDKLSSAQCRNEASENL